MGRKRPARSTVAVAAAATITTINHSSSATSTNFLTLPDEIRHKVYTSTYPTFIINILKSPDRKPSRLTYEIAPRRPHECRHTIKWTFQTFRRITASILSILLTCKQVKEEYEFVLRSTHMFRICFNGSSVKLPESTYFGDGHLINMLDFKSMPLTARHALRKVMLTFEYLGHLNYQGSDLEHLKRATHGFDPSRKRPAQDAIARSIFGRLTHLDVHLIQPPRYGWKILPHDEATMKECDLWFKTLEPVLRIIGRAVGSHTEVRIFYDTKQANLTLLTRDLVERCFIGQYTTCYVDKVVHARTLPGICRHKDCPTRYAGGPASEEEADDQRRHEIFEEQSGTADLSPEDMSRYADESELTSGLGVPR